MTTRHADVTITAQCRLAIFQPTRAPRSVVSVPVETAFGRAAVSGRLGQRHADLLECAAAVAVERGIDSAGRYCLVVDPHHLRMAMGAGRSRACWDQVVELAHDLRVAEIVDLHVYGRPTARVVTAGILDSIMTSGIGTLRGKAGRGDLEGERELWMIPYSPAWSRLIGADLPINYHGQLLRIVALRHGFSQAIARFLLSHQLGARYGRAAIWAAIRPGGRPRDRWDEMQKDAKALEEMGILIEGDIIRTAAPATQIPAPATQIPVPATQIPVV